MIKISAILPHETRGTRDMFDEHDSFGAARQADRAVEAQGESSMRSVGKYWTARRIIFVSGALFALAFCNFAGSTSAWFVAALIAIVFSIVTVFHTRVRDSLTAKLTPDRDQTRSDRPY